MKMHLFKKHILNVKCVRVLGATLSVMLVLVLTICPSRANAASSSALDRVSNATRISAYQNFLNNIKSRCNAVYDGELAIKTTSGNVSYYRIYYAFAIGYFVDAANTLRPYLIVMSDTVDSYGISGGSRVEFFAYSTSSSYDANSEETPYPHIRRVATCSPTSRMKSVQFYDSKTQPNEYGIGEVELFSSSNQPSNERNWMFLHTSSFTASEKSQTMDRYLTIEYRNGKYYAWASGCFTADVFRSQPLDTTRDATLISPAGTARQTKNLTFTTANISSLSSGSVALAKGWYWVNGAYYYYSSGEKLTNGWVSYGGKYYYMDKNGNAVVNGWAIYGGKYYYMNSNGNPVVNGWVQYSGKYYYMNKSGNPVVNDWIQYKGTYYHFDDSGVCDRTYKAA